MASISTLPSHELQRRVQKLQTVTVAWMVVEAAVSLISSWMARSPALLAFGGDSAIELASALVVLWAFRNSGSNHKAERLASRVTGLLLFVLAAYVVLVSIVALAGFAEPKPTVLGMAVLAVAVVLMPWLSREKRRLSALAQSASLRADAAQSGMCAYLALIALVGIAVNAIWHIRWADPAAALAIVPLVIWEGWEAVRGKPCGCH